ncbi:MAG TPA: DUF1587 domain-containing protein, partial [Polyangiales bacterium]|nr:DUF1587 domain-containing protein [Polyangiales bacterium]
MIDDVDVGAAGRAASDPGKRPPEAGAGPAGGGSAAEYLGSPTLARRLSRVELDNTLRDLLGDETAPASHGLAEDLYAPYDNDYPSQLASSAYVEALDLFASDAASRALSNAAQRKQL